MNSAVGSPITTSPMERRPSLLTVNGTSRQTGLAHCSTPQRGAGPWRTPRNAGRLEARLKPRRRPQRPPAPPRQALPPPKKPARQGRGGLQGPTRHRKSQGSYAIGVSVGENLRRAKSQPHRDLGRGRSPRASVTLSPGKVQMSQEYQTKIMALIQGAARTAGGRAQSHRRRGLPRRETARRKTSSPRQAGPAVQGAFRPGTGENPKPSDPGVP